MEISAVRRRVDETIDRAKRRAAERRSRVDEAGREFDQFLERTAVPLFRQIVNVLRADGFAFNVFTPSGSVRLASERHAEDYIEIGLDTGDEAPQIVGHMSHRRGRRIVEAERPIGQPGRVSEEELLAFVLKELEPLVEK